jgi:hypothetical protein
MVSTALARSLAVIVQSSLRLEMKPEAERKRLHLGLELRPASKRSQRQDRDERDADRRQRASADRGDEQQVRQRRLSCFTAVRTSRRIRWTSSRRSTSAAVGMSSACRRVGEAAGLSTGWLPICASPSSEGDTPSASRSRRRVVTRGSFAPRSTRPTWFGCRPALAATSSWLRFRSRRSCRNHRPRATRRGSGGEGCICTLARRTTPDQLNRSGLPHYRSPGTGRSAVDPPRLDDGAAAALDVVRSSVERLGGAAEGVAGGGGASALTGPRLPTGVRSATGTPRRVATKHSPRSSARA